MPLEMDIGEAYNNDVEMETIFPWGTSNIFVNVSSSRSTMTKDSTLGRLLDNIFIEFEDISELTQLITTHMSSTNPVRRSNSRFFGGQEFRDAVRQR